MLAWHWRIHACACKSRRAGNEALPTPPERRVSQALTTAAAAAALKQEEESGDVHMPSEEERLQGLRSQVLAALVKAENALELEQQPTADQKNPLSSSSNSSSSDVELSPLSRKSITDVIGATAAANHRLSAGSPRSSLSSGSRRDLES